MDSPTRSVLIMFSLTTAFVIEIERGGQIQQPIFINVGGHSSFPAVRPFYYRSPRLKDSNIRSVINLNESNICMYLHRCMHPKFANRATCVLNIQLFYSDPVQPKSNEFNYKFHRTDHKFSANGTN